MISGEIVEFAHRQTGALLFWPFHTFDLVRLLTGDMGGIQGIEAFLNL